MFTVHSWRTCQTPRWNWRGSGKAGTQSCELYCWKKKMHQRHLHTPGCAFVPAVGEVCNLRWAPVHLFVIPGETNNRTTDSVKLYSSGLHICLLVVILKIGFFEEERLKCWCFWDSFSIICHAGKWNHFLINQYLSSPNRPRVESHEGQGCLSFLLLSLRNTELGALHIVSDQ